MTVPVQTGPIQLTLDLPHRPALGAEDFLVSGANAAAVALIDRWPDWPLASALVVGPRQSGKSHLGNVWRLKADAAEAIAATHLAVTAVATLHDRRALLIEDLDLGIGDEQALFHLLNLAREHRYHLLLTSARAPGDLDVALPDLRSRLRALPVVGIAMPDADLLRALLVKLFADRQLTVEPHVIAHLVLHMERSMEAAVRHVEAIDKRALATHRRVTRAMAAEVLAQLLEMEGGPAS